MSDPTGAPDPAGTAPHAPKVGWAKRLLGPLYFTSAFWYKFPGEGMKRTPVWMRIAALPIATVLCFVFLGNIRRAIGRNRELVEGKASWYRRQRWAWSTFYQFAWCYMERFEQFLPGFKATSTVEARHHWDKLIDAGRGFVLVTAHIGHWEMGSTLPTSKSDLEIHLVREPEIDPKAQEYTEQLVAQLGGARYVTHFAQGELDLGLELANALKDGHIVALQGDRPRTGGQMIEAPLFGTTFPFPRGVSALARLTRTPLLPVFLLRTGRRSYNVIFRPPIQVERTRNRDADLLKATTTLASEIEWAVRREPAQWFCLREI